MSAYRAGEGSRENAVEAISAAADVFVRQGYTGTFEYQDLWRWALSLGLDLPPASAQRPVLPPVEARTAAG